MVNQVLGGHVEIKNLSKSFIDLLGNSIPTVDNVTLDIAPGDFFCLMGPSGCGKTTLLRTIAGLCCADEGELLLDGVPITGTSYERGLVFQNPELFKWMNVEQNVAFGLKARRVYRQEKGNVQKYMDLVGLTGFEKSLPHQLSGGMQQRVAFARALINHPKVFLLDEPFGALDAFTRVALQERLVELWKSIGTTAVMVTHDVEEAVVLATRIVVMSNRPTRVKKVICNNIDYPRDRNDTQVIKLKKEILSALHEDEVPLGERLPDVRE